MKRQKNPSRITNFTAATVSVLLGLPLTVGLLIMLTYMADWRLKQIGLLCLGIFSVAASIGVTKLKGYKSFLATHVGPSAAKGIDNGLSKLLPLLIGLLVGTIGDASVALIPVLVMVWLTWLVDISRANLWIEVNGTLKVRKWGGLKIYRWEAVRNITFTEIGSGLKVSLE